MLDTAISTAAFPMLELQKITEIAKRFDWKIEFSSGLGYREEALKVFLNANIKKIHHNYFPAPKEPFVLNLASSNPEIRRRSINHCLHGIDIADKIDAPFYSAHAGFCVDPNPEELGVKIKKREKFDRNIHFDLFLESVQEILEYAKKQEQVFLIENNVTNMENVKIHGQNPFICSNPEEIIEFCESVMSSSFGFLLDTAHLKVTSNTMSFDLKAAVTAIKKWIRCIHHSDNDGREDSNLPITEDYWFLEYMNDFKHCLHVLEVKNQSEEQLVQQLAILNRSI